MTEDFEVGGPPPEESSNRTFVIAAAGVGGLLVLSMICLGLYALVLAPRQREARNAQATQIILDNTKMAASLTETAGALHPSPTKAPTRTPVPSPTMTPTAVVVVASPTPTATMATLDPGLATAIAQATLAAAQGGGGGTPTPTGLPSTGFADEVGLPGLVVLGVLLVVVAVVARQLRTRSAA